MKKETTTHWIADDGTVFTNRKDCVEYENRKKTLYRVTYRAVLEYNVTILANNQEEAARMLEKKDIPNFDEWYNAGEEKKWTILKTPEID